MAAGQQPATPTATPPGQVQPQVWPPAQPAQSPVPGSPQNMPQAQPGAIKPLPAPGTSAPRPPSGELQLNVVVTDKQGKPIAGLERGDFTLLDNNHAAEIQSFRAFSVAADMPQDEGPAEQIVLVIDDVNVDFQQIAFSRFGIDQFLRRDAGRLEVPVSIYLYTDTGLKSVAAPSTDGNATATHLDAEEGQLRTLNRSSGAWGAIERFEMSLDMLDKMAKSAVAQPGRKLLIWIGAGWPILDNPNMEMTWKQQQQLFENIVSLSTTLREADMQIYSVTAGMPNSFTYLYEGFLKGVKKPSQANLPDLDLKVLSVESGGKVMSPSNDLGAQIEDCARDAIAYYAISFTPLPADGPNEYHELKVRVDKPGLTARTSTGYYNQPPGSQEPR